jgi:hypothetical protein
MEDKKDVLKVVFCVVISKTTVVYTKHHVTRHTFENHRSCEAPFNTRGIGAAWGYGQASAN